MWRFIRCFSGRFYLIQGKQPIFYVIVFEPYIPERQVAFGVKEYVTKIVEKPKENVHAKTINYIENALMANLAKVILKPFRKKEAIKALRLFRIEFYLRQLRPTSLLSLGGSSQLLVLRQ